MDVLVCGISTQNAQGKSNFLFLLHTLLSFCRIDKDNNVDMSNDEFQSLILAMPAYAVVIDSELHPVKTNTGDVPDSKMKEVTV